MTTIKTTAAAGVVGGALIAAGIGGCQPDPVQVDPTFSRPLSSAISLDTRIAEHRAPQAVLPIMGGTLLVTGATAIVSDPDRDRVVVVDLVVNRVRGEISVPGGQPGRITEDGSGRVHVVLRESGEVLSFDPRDVESAERHAVCQSPRGIAYDASTDALQIACRDGFLVTMGTDGVVSARVNVDEDDLRDIVATPAGLVVSRFRAAELVQLDREGHALTHVTPASQVEGTDRHGQPIEFVPQVAWRLAARGNRLAVVHQRATDREIELDQPDAYGSGGGGGGFDDGSGGFLGEGAARRPASNCGGIVRTTVSIYDQQLQAVATQNFAGVTLPVDVAISPDGGSIAIVAAAEQGGMTASVFEQGVGAFSDPCFPSASATIPSPVAVAYTQAGQLVVQQRDPAQLWVGGRAIALGGEERFDAGHAIFHGNAGLGLACASCHPEGGDDGHVWSFAGFGSLRTPTLHGGILETAPFHWNGDLPSIGALMSEVFERRMGGPTMSDREEGALAGWIDQLPVSPGREGLDEAQVERGARLFWGEAQCGSCHTGGQYTNNATVDVGTGGLFQVPSLIGVSFRLPVMHDGCASTLAERFDPACGGGDQHGRTSQLSAAQTDDLIVYLETL